MEKEYLCHPAEMPVLQPTQFDLVINMRAAKALGLSLSKEVLSQAGELIE